MSDDAKVPLPPMPPMTEHEWVRGITVAGYTATQMRDYARAYGAEVERAARAAAFREAAEVCQQRKYPEHEADMDAECSAYNSGCEDCADALRARATEQSNG